MSNIFMRFPEGKAIGNRHECVLWSGMARNLSVVFLRGAREKRLAKNRDVYPKSIYPKAAGVDEKVLRKVEAVIYTMADKYLDAEEMKQLKGVIRMTRIGQMLYDDGKEEGIELTKKVYKSQVIAQECNIPVSQVEKNLIC